MNLLTAENISKSYVEKKLFNNISLGINEGDKIGLIGVNGTGKSTLLKVLAGLEEVDSGRIVVGNSIRIEYLPQNPIFDDEDTVINQVFRGNSKEIKIIRAYEEALLDPKAAGGEKITRLIQKMDDSDIWNIESEAKAVLTRLGLSDFNVKVGTLSGGQRKRIALASALINPSELLILDEPTNHLDNETIDWLEEYLNKRKGAFIMITHDRYFLDRVANHIIELDRGELYTYEGNYSLFLEKKLERENIERANEKKRQSLLRKELAWIKRGAKARTTKQKARIDRFEKLKEDVPGPLDEKIEISLAGSRLGKKVINLNHINKSFKGKNIIDDFNYIVLPDDRIGIVGPNGSGKSTLINIIGGMLQPDSGEVEMGQTVKIGIYSQENRDMDESLRVIEYIREGGEFLTTAKGDKISASKMLEKFLFSPSLQWTFISKLSGGERRRLYLLRVLMEEPNVLLLDEPTNDLDIQTLTILEDYIDDFKGAVIAVSHDRYFLDRMAEKIFAFQGDGKIVQYTGNYSYFKQNIHNCEEKNKQVVDKKSFKEDKSSYKREKKGNLKFSYKEKIEYENIDNVILEIENKIENIDHKISEAGSDYNLLQDLLKDKKEFEMELEHKMERWVYLNELAEKIDKDK